MSKPVQNCLQAVEAAERTMNENLKGTEYSLAVLELTNLFRRIKMRLQFMGGVMESSKEENKERRDKFPPITNFMGDEIKIEKPTDKKQLLPKQEELKKLRNEVHELFEKMPDLAADQVLHAYTLPEHHIVIRGVAKVAGIEEYESAEINAKFIEDIKAAVILKKEQAAQAKKAGSAAQVLTQDMIDADPELQALNARPGDELVVTPKGKKTLKKQAA